MCVCVCEGVYVCGECEGCVCLCEEPLKFVCIVLRPFYGYIFQVCHALNGQCHFS